MSAEAMLLRRIEALEIELDAVRRELSRVPVRSPVGSGGGECLWMYDEDGYIVSKVGGWRGTHTLGAPPPPEE